MSKKKNKIRQTPWSLSSIPLSEVAVKNPNAPEDRATLLARLQREEAEAKRNADPICQAEQKLDSTMRALQKLSSEFWSRPIDKIIADGDCESAKDVTFNVPALRNEYTFEDAKSAFNTWFATTFSKSGYELTEVGGQRLVRFGVSQGRLAGADMSNAAAWQIAFEHLKDNLKAFQPGDFVKVPRIQHVKQAPPKPTLADIETLNIGGNEEDARKAKRLAQELMWAEGSPLHTQWMASLYENFNFFPTDADLKYIYNELFPRNNWSYVDHRSFDKARRAMVAQGRWSDALLTRDELFTRDLEQGPALATLGFNEKQRLLTQVKRMRDPD